MQSEFSTSAQLWTSRVCLLVSDAAEDAEQQSQDTVKRPQSGMEREEELVVLSFFVLFFLCLHGSRKVIDEKSGGCCFLCSISWNSSTRCCFSCG